MFHFHRYICGGALLFCKWEEHWSFMDSSYFCFISLSTIGFGDLVPGDKIYGKGNDFYSEVFELSFVFCSIYLMLGMALIAMCFNLMQVRIYSNLYPPSCDILCCVNSCLTLDLRQRQTAYLIHWKRFASITKKMF